MSERLRVGVVGCGIGKHHMQAYASLPELFDLQVVCDVDADKAQATAAELGIPKTVTDFEALCQMDLDVIDICTPPFLHYQQILGALKADKYVVCEKPLVGSVQEVDALIAAEAASDKRIMPIFQYRFGQGLQKLKFLIEQGIAGKPYLSTVETAWRRRAAYYEVPWRGKWSTEMGGALLGHAIHGHDLLVYVAGPIRNVFSRSATLVNDIEVEDTAAASLLMADGSLATLAVTLGSPHEISRHRFCFANLVAESNTRPYTSSGEPWTFVGDTPEIDRQIADALADFTPLPEGFAGQFWRFAQAIRTGGELPVTLQDSRASLELVTALYESARNGQAVELPLGPEHPAYDSWLPR